MSCRVLCACAAATLALLFSSVSHAEIIWGPSSTAVTIEEVNEMGGLLVGDKLFTDFSVMSSGTAPIKPTAADIAISGILSGEDYGVILGGPWFAFAGQVLDTVITFQVSVSPQSSPYRIKDVGLSMNGVTLTELPDAFVQIHESVYAAPGYQQKDRIASGDVYQNIWDTDSDFSQDFRDPSGAPVSYPTVWVRKDIMLYGGTRPVPPGTPHGPIATTLSVITQTFSQEVPEPQSLVLLLCGVPALALFMWRRVIAGDGKQFNKCDSTPFSYAGPRPA